MLARMTPVGRAFKFYLWQRSYKVMWQWNTQPLVVICFQILSLTTFLQGRVSLHTHLLCCDLLSNFIFDNVLTRIPSNNESTACVVICFQILSLTTFLQDIANTLLQAGSCDLLSNFIFDNVLTRSWNLICFLN